jgi:outer membrane protein OmpA-like peptidoglycan-associated protein
MTFSTQFKDTLGKTLQLDKLKKFIKTKEAFNNNEKIWLFSKEELEQKDYMNSWDLVLAESLIITLVTAFFLYVLKFFADDNTYILLDMLQSSNSHGFFKSLVILAYIAATIFLLSKLVIPRNHPNKNDKMGLVILTYHLGAKGLLPGIVYATSMYLTIALLSTSSPEYKDYKEYSIYLFGLSFFCIVWIYILAFFGVVKARAYYESPVRYFRMVVKFLIAYLILSLFIGIVIAVIQNLPVIKEVVYNYYLDLVKMKANDHKLFVQRAFVVFIFISGLIMFPFSKEKKNIIKYSILFSLVYVLGGCSSSSVVTSDSNIENYVVDIVYFDGFFNVLFQPYENPFLYRVFLNISLCTMFSFFILMLNSLLKHIWNIFTLKNKTNSVVAVSIYTSIFLLISFYEPTKKKYNLFIKTSPASASIKLLETSSSQEILPDYKSGDLDSRADGGDFLFNEGIYILSIDSDGYKERRIRFRLDKDKDLTIKLKANDTDGDLVPDIHDNCTNTKQGIKVDQQGCSGAQINKKLKKLIDQFSELVHFDFNSIKIKKEDEWHLHKKAEFLTENRGVRALIEGHASNDEGSPEKCISLGNRRAIAISNYLIGLGVQKEQLTMVSYGKEKPLFKSNTMSSFEKNRRAVLNFNF